MDSIILVLSIASLAISQLISFHITFLLPPYPEKDKFFLLVKGRIFFQALPLSLPCEPWPTSLPLCGLTFTCHLRSNTCFFPSTCEHNQSQIPQELSFHFFSILNGHFSSKANTSFQPVYQNPFTPLPM